MMEIGATSSNVVKDIPKSNAHRMTNNSIGGCLSILTKPLIILFLFRILCMIDNYIRVKKWTF